MSHVGEPIKLDVFVARKTFQTSAGESRGVIEDFALSLREGEVVALVGPSGCGKTTLLRIIAGLDADFSGHVTISPPHRIGMVFQEPRLLPWRSVEQNLRLAAPHASNAELDMLCDLLGLSAHRDHFPGELSLGLARRAAVARAFAVDPDLLLLDEPFVSLDVALALRLRDELGDIIERKKVTTLLVTHDLDEAIRLADRILLLSPRPAHLVAEIPIEHPRKAMNFSEAAALRERITKQFARV
jgi:NitT/TauT family transport system ATP-binding protein